MCLGGTPSTSTIFIIWSNCTQHIQCQHNTVFPTETAFQHQFPHTITVTCWCIQTAVTYLPSLLQFLSLTSPPLGLCLDCQTPSIFLILFHLSHNSAYLTLPCLSHYSAYCHNTQPIWHFPVCLITQSIVTSLSLFDIYFPVCLITQSIVTSLSLFDISLSVSLLSLLSQHSAYLTFSCVSHYSVYCHVTQPVWHLFPCLFLITQSIVTSLSLFDIYFPVCLITQSIWHFPVRLIIQSIVTLLSLLDISLSVSLLSLLSHHSAYLTFPCLSHYSVYCHITQPIWHLPVCLITQSIVTSLSLFDISLSVSLLSLLSHLLGLFDISVFLNNQSISVSLPSPLSHYCSVGLLSLLSLPCLTTQILPRLITQCTVSLLSRFLTFLCLSLLSHCSADLWLSGIPLLSWSWFFLVSLLSLSQFPRLNTQSISLSPVSILSLSQTFPCLITQSISLSPVSILSLSQTFPCLITQSISDFALSHNSDFPLSQTLLRFPACLETLVSHYSATCLPPPPPPTPPVVGCLPTSLDPAKSGSPVCISTRMQPRLHMSMARS